MGRRHRVYGYDKEFKLYSDNISLGAKCIGRISGDRGEAMVLRGEAIRIEHPGGEIKAYQACVRAPRPQEVVERFTPSSTAFSRAETEAIVGLRGKSKTAGMSDLARAKRVASGRSAEDLVETAQAKFKVYRKTH